MNKQSLKKSIVQILFAMLFVIATVFAFVPLVTPSQSTNSITAHADTLSNHDEDRCLHNEGYHYAIVGENGDYFILQFANYYGNGKWEPGGGSFEERKSHFPSGTTSKNNKTIYYYDDDEGDYFECSVPVVNVESVTLEYYGYTSYEGKVGDFTYVNYLISPGDANNQNVTWSTTNKNVATAYTYHAGSHTGRIDLVGVGEADIIVKTEDQGKTASFHIKVLPNLVTGVSLNKSAIQLSPGLTSTLTPTVAPNNATNKKVSWESADTNVATVANGVVTAVSGGTTTITVTTEDQGKTATCTVHVHDFEYSTDGNSIVATCKNTDQCNLEGGVSVSLDEDTTKVPPVKLGNADKWKEVFGQNGLPTILYTEKDTENYSDTFVLAAGTFVAKIEMGEAVVTREFTIAGYNVTVYLGTASQTINVPVSATVTLTAGTYKDKKFNGWVTETATLASNDATTTFVMPNNDVLVEATYLDCYPFIIIEGNTINGEPVAETDPAKVTVSSTPEGKRFVYWTAENPEDIEGNESSTEFTITMPSRRVILTANYIDLYKITVNNGSSDVGYALNDETVTITADSDDDDKKFIRWVGEGVTFDNAEDKTTTFVMPEGAVTVSAEFESSYTVAVTNGTASGINASKKAFAGATITITADSDTNDKKFKRWVGEGVNFDNAEDRSTTFVMPASAVSVTAEYYESHGVIVTEGSVTDGLNGANKAFLNDEITISATGKTGFRFGYWSGEGVTFDDATSATTTFSMLDSAVTVVANYIRQVAVPVGTLWTYTYTQHPQTFVFTDEGGKEYYTLSELTFTDAGDHIVTATLKDTTATEWADGTTAPQTYTFTINPMLLPEVKGDPRTFMANGKEQTFLVVTLMNGKNYNFDGKFYFVEGNKKTDAGEYTVTAKLDPNYAWEDGTVEPRTYTFTILPDKVEELKQMNAYVYYVRDAEGDLVNTLSYAYTIFDYENTSFKKQKVSSVYTPYLYGAPQGAKATFYICEPFTGKNPVKWDDLTFERLSLMGGVTWAIYADVTCPGYADYRTPITRQSNLIYVEGVEASIYCTKKYQNLSVDLDIAFPASGSTDLEWYLAMIPVPYPKVSVKTSYETTKCMQFSRFVDSVLATISALEGDYYSVTMYYKYGDGTKALKFTKQHLGELRSLLVPAKSAPRLMMPRMMLLSEPQAPVFDDSFVEGAFPNAMTESYLVGDSFDPDLTPEVPDTIPTFDQALLERLEEIGTTADEDYTVTFEYMYMDPENIGYAYNVTKKYAPGSKLSADDIPTREGYVFLGWYYTIVQEKTEIKLGEVAPKEDYVGERGDAMNSIDYVNGMVYFDPENDFVTSDIKLYARWMNVDDFNKAKNDALSAIDTANATDPLKDETVLTDAKTAINDAKTIEQIAEIKADALIAISEQQALELANAKEEAIVAVKAENDKDPINKVAVLNGEVAKINACTTKAEVETAMNAGISAIQARQHKEHVTAIVLIVLACVLGVAGIAVVLFVLYKKGKLDFKKIVSNLKKVAKEKPAKAKSSEEKPAKVKSNKVKSSKAKHAEVVAEPKKETKTSAQKQEEKWVEEDREYLAHHAMHVTEDENGEYVVGVFFRNRRHKLYWFKYDEVDFEVGELAQYRSIEGDMRDVVVAIPKIKKDMSGHEHDLKSLSKKN